MGRFKDWRERRKIKKRVNKKPEEDYNSKINEINDFLEKKKIKEIDDLLKKNKKKKNEEN